MNKRGKDRKRQSRDEGRGLRLIMLSIRKEKEKKG
jgi:hypothetical protein